jgi:hypothetical protein
MEVKMLGFKKKTYFPLTESKIDPGEWKNHPVIKDYADFYRRHEEEDLCLYGLHPLADKGRSGFYFRKPYSETLRYDFPFDDACVWEEMRNKKQAAEAEEKVQYGAITIGSEGCGIYWIYIVCGKFSGQVWILTEQGVTPVSDDLTLDAWHEGLSKRGAGFWHPVLSAWGKEKNDFFYGHAVLKSVAAEQDTLGVSSPLCLSCLTFLSGYANRKDRTLVISDPLHTYVFGASPEDTENWTCCRAEDGTNYYKQTG